MHVGNPIEDGRRESLLIRVRAKYESALGCWQTRTFNQVADFKARAVELLSRTIGGDTDVTSALVRSELFHRERDGDGSDRARFTLMMTDGQDTVGRGPLPLSYSSELIVVNGIASSGILTDLKPLLFENIDSAIAFIANESEGASQ